MEGTGLASPLPSPSREPAAFCRDGRLWPVDALRGAAVIGMVETHVYNTGANPTLLATPWAPFVDALNGLVAPLFFVLTGFMLELRPAGTAAAFGRRLRTLTLWWALAMLLHLPRVDEAGGWIDFSPSLNFDVLQALALSALSLTLIQTGVPENRRSRLLAGLAAGVLILTAMVDRSHWAESLNLWFRGWVIHDAYSRFPLLPWSAFLLFGAWLATSCKGSNRSAADFRRAGFAWALVGAGALVMWRWPVCRNLTGDLRANPLFTIGRASAVALIILPSLGWQRREPTPLLKGLAWLGRRSLFLYAAHLFIFFTVAMPGGSWAARTAARLSFPHVLALTAALLALSTAACLARERCLARFQSENPLGESPS